MNEEPLNWRLFGAMAAMVGVFFLAAFLRDTPLHEPTITEWRQALLATLDSSFQFAWCGILAGCCMFLLILNSKYASLRGLKISHLFQLQESDALAISCWLIFFVMSYVLVGYGLQYQQSSHGTDMLVLLSCIMLNQWLIWSMKNRSPKDSNSLRSGFVNAFMLLAFFCLLLSPLNPDPNVLYGGQFSYHGQTRWTGIWQNPNLFGLLMAVIFVLSIGRACDVARKKSGFQWAFYLLPICAAGTCLIKSYSRGAWIASAGGLAVLTWKQLGLAPAETNPVRTLELPGWQKRLLWLTLGIVIGCLLGFGIKKTAHLENPVLQRILSAFTKKDFSSQNRLASYQDGINMLLDHPIAGYGWANVIDIHSALYMQSGLSTGEALKLNDFLMLALRLGLPMFSVFLLFLWVWLSAGTGQNHSASPERDNDVLLCRIATLILALGFLSTDGFFRMASGGAFWLFLTLSLDFAAINPSSPELPVTEPAGSVWTVPNK